MKTATNCPIELIVFLQVITQRRRYIMQIAISEPSLRQPSTSQLVHQWNHGLTPKLQHREVQRITEPR